MSNNLTRRFAALVCTAVMSATCIVGAVGPAYALGGRTPSPIVLTV